MTVTQSVEDTVFFKPAYTTLTAFDHMLIQDKQGATGVIEPGYQDGSGRPLTEGGFFESRVVRFIGRVLWLTP